MAALTPEQVVGIYTNQINNWQAVGGRDAPIVVINKAEGSSTLEVFEDYYALNSAEIHADLTIVHNEDTIAAVEADPNTISYVSIGAAEYDIVNGAPLKLLPVDGIMATMANISNETFPITRVLTLVTHDPPTGLTQDFITYAQSQAVEDLVREQSFVRLE